MSGTRRRNFRRDCPEAEGEWRKRRRYAETEYRYGKKSGREYVPFNHFGITREGVAEELAEASDDTDGDGSDHILDRPIGQVEPGEWVWHARGEWWTADEDDGETDWTASPVENEVKRADVEAGIMRFLVEAVRTRTRDRFPAISRVLDEASEVCSADFAERLVDAVNAAYPDYRDYCLRTVEGYHRRGRKPQHERQEAA